MDAFISDFLMPFGLFFLKTLTLLLLLIVLVIVINMIVASKQANEESIEIQKINEKLEAMQDALESEILPKDWLKLKQRQKRKKEKEEAKALKQRLREKESETAEGDVTHPDDKSRLFVLKFEGDMHASETDQLRECITAILCVAEPRDEVLVLVESHGGLVHHYGLAASQLARIKQQGIPLTVGIDLIAASGGYLMACVADKILAAPFAVVGSIGVFAQVPNIHRLLEKNNIDIEQHTAGEYKTTLTLLGKNTDKDRRKFKEELEDTHDLFKSFVSTYRNQLDIHKVATGEHWYGTQAIDLKLIDELITSDDYLVQRAKEWDIFAVRYVIHETLSSKLSQFLHEFCVKMTRVVFKITQRNSTF